MIGPDVPSGASMQDDQFDSRQFREVLGNLPTGVVVITASSSEGDPIGMTVGSFASVSLDPPLVGFFPDKSSTSFPAIRQAGSFCVNVLSAHQESVCRTFATRGADRFKDLTWRPASSGAPILDGTVAWIDCEIAEVREAGDHYIVLGRVRDLGVGLPTIPLLFFQGGYGGFIPTSQATGATTELLGPLRVADRARPAMEALAVEVGAQCHAHAVIGGEAVCVASAYPTDASTPSYIGMRFPIVPPWGEVFMAWMDEEAQHRWLSGLGTALSPDQRNAIHANMADMRRKGWAFTVRAQHVDRVDALLGVIREHGQTPATQRELASLMTQFVVQGDADRIDELPAGSVRTVSVPVFDSDGGLALMISLHELPTGLSIADVKSGVEGLRAAAAHVTQFLATSG